MEGGAAPDVRLLRPLLQVCVRNRSCGLRPLGRARLSWRCVAAEEQQPAGDAASAGNSRIELKERKKESHFHVSHKETRSFPSLHLHVSDFKWSGGRGWGGLLWRIIKKKKTSSVVSSMCGRCGNGFQGTMMPTVSGFDRVLIPPSNALARSPVCTVIVNKILYGSSFPL